jgi:hypothetical protein
VNQAIHPSTDTDSAGFVPDAPRDWIWASLIGSAFVASTALAYRPTLDSAVNIGRAILPWLVLAGLVLAWSGRSRGARLTGISIAIGGWFLLAVEDDRWTLLSFALYGMCFIVDSNRLQVGVTLAGVVSGLAPRLAGRTDVDTRDSRPRLRRVFDDRLRYRPNRAFDGQTGRPHRAARVDSG